MVARTLDQKYKDLWKTYVGFDYYKVGQMKGKWVVENLKPGKIAMLNGPAGALVSVNMEKGFKEVVEKGGFQVVWAQNSVQTRENGLKLAEDALVSQPDVVAIYAMNDDLALGAAQAVKASSKNGKVATLGMNGAPSALAAIHNGDLSMTILLDPVGWGKSAAQMVADYLKASKQPSELYEPFVPEVVSQANAYEKIPEPLAREAGREAEELTRFVHRPAHRGIRCDCLRQARRRARRLGARADEDLWRSSKRCAMSASISTRAKFMRSSVRTARANPL